MNKNELQTEYDKLKKKHNELIDKTNCIIKENHTLQDIIQDHIDKEEERYNNWLKQNKEFLDRYLSENIVIDCINEYSSKVIKIYCGNNIIAKTDIL